MRSYIFLMFLLAGLNTSSQISPVNEILLKADYAQVQHKLYRNANSIASLSSKQTDAYNIIATFIKKYPKSENGLYLIADAVNLTLEQIDALISFTDTLLDKSPYKSSVKNTKRRIEVAETGKLFPALNLADTLGNITSIESYRGNFILIDFWSSWCSPCRQQIPRLINIYNKYKNKNFHIIGISLDHDKTAWLNAISEDKQPWVQYCELSHWQNNKIAKRFFISGIPSNYLLNKDGIILGQDLSPDQVSDLVSNQ